LLLGPRQVGKSTLIKSLSLEVEINLADEFEFLKYSSNLCALFELVDETKYRNVYIDEIQRLPKLLNTIQVFIDNSKYPIKFYLTGPSARKLKRGGANLLPDRMVNFQLGPFVSQEFDYAMDTLKILEFGSLPEVYLSSNDEENKRILKSYSANYIKEEIKAEALVRNLDSFARFFMDVLTCAADFIDYTKMSQHSKISRHIIPRYFEILEDTLIGSRVFHYDLSEHNIDLIKHPKFYYFDNGIYNGLLGNFNASLDRIGKLSEQLVFSQLLHSSWANEIDIKINTFRERSGIEVDFIVTKGDETYAIEVKRSDDIQSDDLFGLKFFDENIKIKNKKMFVFHMAKKEEKRGKIWVLPWQKGLKEIGL